MRHASETGRGLRQPNEHVGDIVVGNPRDLDAPIIAENRLDRLGPSLGINSAIGLAIGELPRSGVARVHNIGKAARRELVSRVEQALAQGLDGGLARRGMVGQEGQCRIDSIGARPIDPMHTEPPERFRGLGCVEISQGPVEDVGEKVLKNVLGHPFGRRPQARMFCETLAPPFLEVGPG